MLQITAVIPAVLQVSTAGMIHSHTEVCLNFLNQKTENNSMKSLLKYRGKNVFSSYLLEPRTANTHKKRVLIISS